MFEVYKPLNATYAYILNQVKSLDILPNPSPMRHNARRPNSRDKCAFHNDVGHEIEDCFTLKDAIEEAMRNFEFTMFMDQGTSQ